MPIQSTANAAVGQPVAVPDPVNLVLEDAYKQVETCHAILNGLFRVDGPETLAAVGIRELSLSIRSRVIDLRTRLEEILQTYGTL